MELSKNPFIRAEARNLKQTGSFTEQAAGGELPEEIRQQIRAAAVKVRKQLEAAGIDPSQARIAVSGAGSTGKSTVAKEIADELGLTHRDLDWEVSKLTHLLGLARAQRKMQFAPGTVAEQIHLVNNVNPDLFDAIIRVHRAPKEVAEQALKRGRGAFQLAAMDYPRLHSAIEAGFKHTEGPIARVGKGIESKVRPPEGFQSEALLDEALQRLGINPEGLKRHQKILSLVKERRTRAIGGGNLPYMKMPEL
jgi:dephospho-CoA kinase